MKGKWCTIFITDCLLPLALGSNTINTSFIIQIIIIFITMGTGAPRQTPTI